MTTARRQSHDPLERLDTPAWMTRALLHHVPWLHGRRVIEPCAGAMAMAFVLEREAGCAVAAFDIEPRHPDVLQMDTLIPGFFEQITLKPEAPIALVTNPPFSLAAAYARRAPMFAVTALLVRITWLEATRDREDVRAPDALIVLPRGRFTGPGAIDPETGQPYRSSDSATVCWALWAEDLVALPRQRIIRVTRREKAELEGRRAFPNAEREAFVCGR